MNKKTIILHIGRHKTGTSAIQQFLHHHRAYLHQNDFHYLELGGKKVVDHKQLAKGLNPNLSKKNKKVLKALRTGIDNAFMKHSNVIISSEGLQNIRDFDRLSAVFEGYDLKVICYLREMLSYKVSAYRQKVHATNYSLGFEHYLKTSPKINYQKFVDLWSSITNNIEVRLFERARLVNQDIVFDFLHALELQPPKTYVPRQTNISLGGNLLWFKLMLNQRGVEIPESYFALLEVARKKESFQKSFCVSKLLAKTYRRKNVSNQFLINSFGEIDFKDFSQFDKIPNLNTIREDLEIIANQLNVDFMK